MTAKIKQVNSPGTYSVDLYYEDGTLVQYQYPAFSRTFIMSQEGYTGSRPPTLGIQNPVVNHGYDMTVQSLDLRRDFRAEQTVDPKLILVNDNPYVASNGYGSVPTNTFVTLIPRGQSWTDIFDILYNKAIDKLNDEARGNLDLSIDVAEARQTAKMLRVTDNVLDLTKTFTRKWGALKAPASAWLQYTYGIKPALSTIHGLAEESIRLNLNKSKKVRGRASEEIEIESVVCWCPDQVAYIKPTGRLKASTTIGVDMLTEDFDITRFSSLNPLSIAWELMPYSFVVDWFLNVGGYLRNAETAMLYASRFRSGYRTDLVAGELKLDQVLTQPYGAETSRFDRIHGDFSLRRIVRSTLGSYPAPTFPSLKAQLGSSRLLSAASLLATMLGRRR